MIEFYANEFFTVVELEFTVVELVETTAELDTLEICGSFDKLNHRIY